MPSSLRIGPFTSEIVAHDVVLLERAEMPVEAIASTTGKYSGLAPAMTAFTATFSTSNSHASRNAVGRIWPTIFSAACFVPFSISSTRSSVGRMIGRKSVQRFSMNSCRRLSSVSGGKSRGVERSNVAPLRSSSSSGRVRPSITPCMNGRFEIGSVPSMYARSSAAERPTTGCGTNTLRTRRHAGRERRGLREAREHVGADRNGRHALLLQGQRQPHDRGATGASESDADDRGVAVRGDLARACPGRRPSSRAA